MLPKSEGVYLKFSFEGVLWGLPRRGRGVGVVMEMIIRSLNIPPPGIPRAFDVFSFPGGREFDELSLPGGGAFDHYS